MNNIHQYMGMSNEGLFEVIGGYIDDYESLGVQDQENDDDIYIKGKKFFNAHVKTIQADICKPSSMNYLSQHSSVNLIVQVTKLISSSVDLEPASAIAVLIARMELQKFCCLSEKTSQ